MHFARSIVLGYHSIPKINWESFLGRREEKLGSFRGQFGDHFGAGASFRGRDHFRGCKEQGGERVLVERAPRRRIHRNQMSRIFSVFSSSKSRLFKSLDSRQLVTGQEIKTFQEQGVVCVRGAFREWVDKLKKGVGANHANPSKDGEWLKSKDSQTFYFNDYFNWRRIPEFEEFVRSSPAAEIAGKLMKSEVWAFTSGRAQNASSEWNGQQSNIIVNL